MDIYEELGTIQVEPFDTFNEELDEMVEYYGRIYKFQMKNQKCRNHLNIACNITTRTIIYGFYTKFAS
jgi:hypothetical protein